MRRIVFVLAVLMLALLFGCSSKPADIDANSLKKDFDGSSLSEKGVGLFYLSTEGGTTEEGNIPTLYHEPNIAIKQIGYWTRNFDGTLLTFLYVDGKQIDKVQLSDTDASLTLGPEYYEVGLHTVEAVQYLNNDPAQEIMLYKRAQYDVVDN